jgi:hypothetical protein
MEVSAQTGAVILVWVAEEESVNIRATFGVPRQACPQILGDIASVLVRGIVGSLADIAVDQDRCVVKQSEQCHIAVANREKAESGSHKKIFVRPDKGPRGKMYTMTRYI